VSFGDRSSRAVSKLACDHKHLVWVDFVRLDDPETAAVVMAYRTAENGRPSLNLPLSPGSLPIRKRSMNESRTSIVYYVMG
jgi:hypothetical protein